MEDMTEEKEAKRLLKTLPARSRINADKDLWDKMTFLKQDCRTSGELEKKKKKSRKFLTQ